MKNQNRIGILDFCLPAYFIFAETVLVILRGGGGLSFPWPAIGFSAGAGLILSGLFGLLPIRLRSVLSMLVLLASAFYFAVESLIRSVFLTYMEPGSLVLGAGGVLSGYFDEFLRSLLMGLPKILIFSVPCIAVFIFIWKMKGRKREASGGKAFYLLSLAAGLALSAALSVYSSDGAMRAIYHSGISFSNTTENFGLLTATRLFFELSVRGSSSESFSSDLEMKEPHKDEFQEAADPKESFLLREPYQILLPEASIREEAEPVSYGKNEMDLDFSGAMANEAARELSEYILKTEASSQNAYSGLFAGKNLILITAESYCDAFISKELTPTLWRLSHSGFYFSDYYQPEWGGSTTSGEMSFLTGLAPQWGDGSMLRTAGNHMCFTMGNQLKELEYESWAFHNGAYDYYSRQLTHPNLGYDHWIANETGMAELCGQEYPNDTSMIEHTIDLWIEKQPFSVYYMTLSGHAPYDPKLDVVKRYYERVSEYCKGRYPEKVLYYICCQMELENMLSIIVSRLEEAGIADDTVIAMVGDHYPYGLGSGEAWGNGRSYISDLMGAPIDHDWQRDTNGLIIWSGCLENEKREMQREISSPVMSLDVLPTLLNLFGLTFDSRLLPGRDVFADTEALVFWSSLDWVTDKGKYDWGERRFYPAEGCGEDPAYVESVNRRVENAFRMSRVIVDTDYYRLLQAGNGS
ncbi:MAG: LTA synthase family protein [Lachnospiraceae bacterium]|nr:LTA synthase family protein [Lachnospiraceae bacterium]